MVRKCIICGAPQKKTSLLSFHRFPRIKERSAKWLEVCHLNENDINRGTLICSKHFLIDDYDPHSIWPNRRLRTSAVPTPAFFKITPYSSFNNTIVNTAENTKTGTHSLQSNVNATTTSSVLNNGINSFEGESDVTKIDSTVTQSVKEYIAQLSTTDFNKLCRACLTLEETACIISEVVYENMNLYEIFENCVAVQMDHNDNLPKYICRSCTVALIQVHAFRKQCEQSENILRTVMLEQNPISHIKDEDLTEEFTEVSSLSPCFNVNPKRFKLEDNLSPEKEEIQTQTITKINSCGSKSRKTQFTCKRCNETFNTHNELKTHHQQVKHPKQRRCKICPECGKTVASLQKHMRTHTKEKPFLCYICKRSFSLKFSLRRHIMTHTDERPYICDVCGKGFTQSKTLVDHKRGHTGEKSFICSYCGISFVRSTAYRMHLRNHNYTKERSLMHNFSVNYECDVCKKRFTTKMFLETHLLRHGEKSFLCSYCGKGFVTKFGLISHTTVHTGDKPYPCKICNKGFTQLGSLKKHMRVHTGEKPYLCEVCSKAFKQRTHLNYHMSTHSGEKPYVCTYCDKSFALKGTLTTHVRIHTGEKPYVCDVCDKGFYDSSSMKKHRKGHGKMEEKQINTSDTATYEFNNNS